MDFATKKISSSQHRPPFPPPNFQIPSHSETSSFPIIAIAIIGILATAFLLVSYYVFVINCCLNWHRIDLLRRLSRSRRPPPTAYSPGIHSRGLPESVIRSIPLLQFKKSTTAGEKASSECAVCLSEFEEDEMLRIIPYCSHLFHIDCIDIWLQNNPNCPLCRTNISTSVLFPTHQFSPPRSFPEDPTAGGDERDYVVIELGGIRSDPIERQEPRNSGEILAGKLEQGKKQGKLEKVTSLGDEWIDTREKDEEFWIQPVRRSVSMDSSAERRMYLAVQAAVRQSAASPGGEGCNGGGRGRRSLFAFAHGRSCRNAVQVQPLDLGLEET